MPYVTSDGPDECVSKGDNLHESSKPILGGKIRKIFHNVTAS